MYTRRVFNLVILILLLTNESIFVEIYSIVLVFKLRSYDEKRCSLVESHSSGNAPHIFPM